MSSVSTVLIGLDRLRIFYETGRGCDSNTNRKNYVPTIARNAESFHGNKSVDALGNISQVVFATAS